MPFSEHLLQLRKERGVKQQDVAAGAGLCLRAYQNYERGLREPKLSALIALADYYKLSLDELIGREQP